MSVARSQISSSSRPRRSWPTSSRWSPSTGANSIGSRPFSLAVVPLAHRDAVGHPQHADRRVARVAVLGVRDGQQRLVARQRADPGVLGVGVEDARVTPPVVTALAHRERRPVVGRPADGHRAPAQVEPRRVAGLGARDGRLGRPAVEGLADPHPELVAVGVVEPPDRGAVGARRAAACAVRPIGDPPMGVRGPVPGVDLPGSGGVRRVDAVVRGIPRPIGHRDARGREPAAPAVLDGVIGEEGVRDLRSRVLAAVRRRRGHAPNPARRCAAVAGWTGRWERMRTGGRDR